MKWWLKNQRGGVTIFLTIILVPMIVICTLYIDVSRIQLARGVATSSADLALNTVLSQYDIDLEQYYGLMGSVQDIEDIYEPAQNSFVLSMQSTTVDATYLQQKITQIQKLFGKSDAVDDLIRIDTDNTTATIENPENANLANPAMMRQQVSEFMKYRCPIDVVQDLENNNQNYSNLLTKLTQVGEASENMPAEAKIQETKQAFFEAKSDMLFQALKVYEALKKYESLCITADYIEKTKGCYEDLYDSFNELHTSYVEYWTNVDNLWSKDFKSACAYRDEASSDYSGEDVDADTIKGFVDDLDTARTEYETKLSEINTTLSGITHCEESYLDMASTDVSHARYWVQLEQDLDESVYDDFIEKLQTLKKAMQTLNTAYDNRHIAEEDSDEDPKDVGDTMYGDKKLSDLVNDATTSANNDLNDLPNTEVGKVSSNAESYFNETKSVVTRSKADEVIKAVVQNTDTASKVTTVSSTDLLKERYEILYQGVEKMGDADTTGTILGEMHALEDEIEKYHEAFTTWKETVEGSGLEGKGSDIYETSKEELAGYEELDEITDDDDPEHKKNAEADREVDLTLEDCTSYENYCSRVIELLDSYMETGRTIYYHGEQGTKNGKEILGSGLSSTVELSAVGINNLASFDDAATNSGTAEKRVDKDAVPVGKDKLKEYTDNTWEFDNKTIDDLVELDKNFTKGEKYVESETLNSPCAAESDKYKIETKTTDIKMVKFLHWQFDATYGESESPTEEASGFLEFLKALFNSGLNDFKSYNNIHRIDTHEIVNEADLPSALAGAAANTDAMIEGGEKNSNDATEQTSGITAAAKFIEMISNLYEGMRDDLYETDYAMNMLSYDTHYMETVYDKLFADGGTAGEDRKIYTIADWNGGEFIIQPGNADQVFDVDSATAYMKDEKTTAVHNKSMTNKVIGAMEEDGGVGYNWAYGNEVEYILSGSTNETNRERVDTILYFTRLAFNMAPTYSEYWKEMWVDSIANAAFVASGGLVPVSLTKFIICTAVLALESYVDEQYLLAGLPVKLIKSDASEFFINLSTDPEDLEEQVKNQANSDSVFEAGQPEVTSKGSFVLSYSDYLSFAFILGTMMNKDNIYLRTADVVQANMSKNSKVDQYEETGFQMSKALTYYTIDTSVRVKPMMVALPYGKPYGTDSLLDTDVWNTFTYKTVEGY